MTARDDGYVECQECGHAIEAHDTLGCQSIGGECVCAESWSGQEIRRARRSEGLPGVFNPLDIS
jgi:hypothetical protein